MQAYQVKTGSLFFFFPLFLHQITNPVIGRPAIKMLAKKAIIFPGSPNIAPV